MTPKLILITGATGGIGSAVSEHLSSNGFRLLLTAREPSRLKELSERLRTQYGADVSWVSTDFSDPDTFPMLLEKLGPALDGAVIMPPQPKSTSECLPDNDVWEELFRVSFIGPVLLIRSILSRLENAPPSKVVIVSGISSAQVMGHYATSNVLRLAWLAQAKTMAHAFGPKRIHFNTLSLGGVLTEKYKSTLQKKASTHSRTLDAQMVDEVSNVPLRKYAEPAEVAQAISSLLSEFTDHITGMNILCDGGFTRAY